MLSDKNPANVNIGIFPQIENFVMGLSCVQDHLVSS